jgi:hypothetical protein
MSEERGPDREVLVKRVEDSLRQVESSTRSLRRINTGLLFSGTLSSAAATLVAGVTAAQGPIVSSGPTGWRISCIVAAVLSFLTAASIGLNQQMKVGDKLVEGHQCAGRLRSLEVAIATHSRDWDEIAKEYEEIVKTYPDVMH